MMKFGQLAGIVGEWMRDGQCNPNQTVDCVATFLLKSGDWSRFKLKEPSLFSMTRSPVALCEVFLREKDGFAETGGSVRLKLRSQ